LDTAIAMVVGDPADGDEVDLVADSGQWIARGVFNSRSRIRVRLYSWDSGQTLEDAWWRARLEVAIALRRSIGYDDPHGAARLVYSEADGLSGLIVDRFGPHLVVQPTALATAVRLERLVALLVEITQPSSVTVRTDPAIARREGIECQGGVIHGPPPPDPVLVEEHGIRYAVRVLSGQKTGSYLDQRENRLQASRYMRGRRVLDMCCYTGGFGLAAARLGGAAHVLGVDTSSSAIEVARDNARRNELSNVRFETGDCFRDLEQRVQEGERFGAVVLDPPKFARGRRGVPEALRAYHRLNRLGVQLLDASGVLVTCSCSGSVRRDDFVDMLRGVANKTGRAIQVLEQRGAAPDHPLNLACPETNYLKCMICRVV
jgi:23S rRNA (cytosine1962-C5)-methyltransferase